ncbi:hypothetical protein ND856_18660 [Leptospira bandrabouensis]|uniref:hypothetical protein n=1 Tax=Leptospira bandrabouensis TaxID=2484903 RepID=UPI00223D0FC0|nr:hypothetical protein [Leptospira bandrabouensis]MCW7460154.1 hypothetical protein [Leptospira bandrabouensis]MCW7479329.1 hypothetical protein [Leptospira bandrabouensis]MCW7487011.1 hypothetical protein [Leptospira bandrabouensis]
MSFSVKLDSKKHLEGLMKLFEDSKKEIKETLDETGDLIIDDAVNVEPKPFLDSGFLQGSSFKQISGKAAVVNPLSESVDPGQDQKQLPIPDGDMEELHLRVGFLAEYAIYLHDNPDATPSKISKRKDINGDPIIKKASMEGRGPFWLSSKIDRFTNSVYIPFIQLRFNQRMDGKKF